MNETTLHQLVTAWAASLGLWTWRFEVTIADDGAPHGNSDAKASVHCSKYYEDAHIEFAKDWLDDVPSQEALDECVVHELLHVLNRDTDEAISTALNALPVGLAYPHEERIKATKEAEIERLARRIVKIQSESASIGTT